MKEKKYSLIHLVAVAFLIPFILLWVFRSFNKGIGGMVTSVVFESSEAKPFSVVGTTFVDNQVAYYFETSGVVTNIYKRKGDKVRSGELIANLDISNERIKQIEEMKEIERKFYKPKSLTEQLRHIEKLHKNKFYNDEELLEKKSEFFRYAKNWDDFNSHMEKLREMTDGKELRAETDGRILSVNINEGQKIGRIDLEVPHIWLELNRKPNSYIALEITDDLLAKTQKGMKFDAGLALNSQIQFSGVIESVSEIANTEDKKNRYYKAMARIENANEKVMSGMKMMVNVYPSDNINRVWVPNDALDIYISEDKIAKTINYIESSDKIKNSSFNEEKSSEVARVTDGSILRSASSKIYPTLSSSREIYILTAGNKIMKALVEVGMRNNKFTEIKTKKLIGARVIVQSERTSWF